MCYLTLYNPCTGETVREEVGGGGKRGVYCRHFSVDVQWNFLRKFSTHRDGSGSGNLSYGDDVIVGKFET